MSFNLGNKLLEIKFVTYLIGKGANGLIYFFSIPIFIKFCGIELYGNYVFIYTAFLMSNSIGTGWISQSVLKFSSKFEQKHSFLKYYNTVINITNINAAVVSLIFTLVIFFLGSQLNTSILVGICCFLSIKYSVKLVFNQSLLNSRIYIFSELIRMLIYVGVPYLFFLSNVKTLQLEVLLMSLLLSYLIGIIFLNFNIKKDAITSKDSFSPYQSKKVFYTFISYGLPLSIWMFLSPSSNGVDRFLIKYFIGFTALAEYSAFYDVVTKIYLQIAQPLGKSAQPILMNSFNKRNFELFNKTLKKSILLLTMAFIVLGSVIYILKDIIIMDYLGFKSEKTISILSSITVPLVFSAYLWQVSIMLQKIIEARKKTVLLTVYILLTAIVSTVLSILFLPKYGYKASAYIMVFGSFLYFSLVSIKLISLNRNENK